MINFYCPKCKKELNEEKDKFFCKICNFEIVDNFGVWRSADVLQEQDKDYYENIYNSEKGASWFQGLKRNKIKMILEKISISYTRERFFKKCLKGDNNLILDLACGAGRDYFNNFGEVVGVDLSNKALQIAKKHYKIVLQSGVNKLPFPDNTFDYVVSSDFFGHVRLSDKDEIIKEIKRVLKPGGITAHIIETDSKNYWLRFAHKNSELFNKYFIEKIGGHVGLEMPTACVHRWEENGFEILKSKKIWGLVWPIKDYASLFDNEYAKMNNVVRIAVFFSNLFGKYKIIEVLVNIILNPINWLVESFFDLDNGQGLMLIAKNK